MVDLSALSQAVEEGDRDKSVQLTTEALSLGVSPSDIIIQGLQSAMSVVGEKYSNGEYFLPDMLLAARAMNTALELLKPLLAGTDMPTIGKVVIGTVEGDIHDIGKNIVAAFLKGSGFEVVDLGINVLDNKFVEEVKDKKPDILGLSALLTTTMPAMVRIIEALKTAGLRSSVKVIVGGAPVTPEYAKHIGADAYAKDGGQAISVCKQLVGK